MCALGIFPIFVDNDPSKEQLLSKHRDYSRTSTHGFFATMPPLSPTAEICQSIHSLLSVSTSLQWPLSPVRKVAVVKRLNCNS